MLRGLEKILLDIDKAIKIIKGTESEGDVVPNLMIGFGIDRIQADYVAEIKLRHLNREYILKRTNDIETLQKEIEELQGILGSKNKQKKFIMFLSCDVQILRLRLKNNIKRYLTDIKQAVHTKFQEIPFIVVVRGKCTHTLAFTMAHEEHTIGKFTAVPYVQPSPRPLQGQHKDHTLYKCL